MFENVALRHGRPPQGRLNKYALVKQSFGLEPQEKKNTIRTVEICLADGGVGFSPFRDFPPVILNGFRVARREKPISPRCVEIIRRCMGIVSEHTFGAETPENAVKRKP